MLPFEVNDRVNIRFDSGEFVQAMIIKKEGEQYLCVALSIGGGYKQGDKFYCTAEQMNKTSNFKQLLSMYVYADKIDFWREQFVKKYFQQEKFIEQVADLNYYNELSKIDEKGKKQDVDNLIANLTKKANDKFDELVALDPTPTKQYFKWILKTYLNGNLLEEDYYKTKLYLDELFKLKLKGKVKGFDINTINSLPELFDIIKGEAELGGFGLLGLAKNEKESNILENDSELEWENENWIVISPKSYEASCILGEGTSWCTATKNYSNQYKFYTEKGKLWIAINKQDTSIKYQFHLETQSFENPSGRKVDLKQMKENYPDLVKGLFGSVEKFHTKIEGENALINYFNYIHNIGYYTKELFPDKETNKNISETIEKIFNANTQIDENGKKRINLNLDNDSLEYILKNLPNLMTNELANSALRSDNVNDSDTIEMLINDYEIDNDTYAEELQKIISEQWTIYPDAEDWEKKMFAILKALISSNKISKEDYIKVIENKNYSDQVILAILGNGKLLTDEESNKYLRGEDYKFVDGIGYIMFEDGLLESHKILENLCDKEFYDVFKRYADGDLWGWMDYSFERDSYDINYTDIIEKIKNEKFKKELYYYIEYKIKQAIKQGENIDKDTDIDDLISELNELDELKDLLERSWEESMSRGYEDEVYKKIEQAIKSFFYKMLVKKRDKHEWFIGGAYDITELENWEETLGDYGSIITTISELDEERIDANFDYIYGDWEDNIEDAIESRLDISDWNEIIATMPKEKIKKKSIEYSIKDEPQLFSNENKGVIFIGADLMGINIEGEREPFSVDWLQTYKTWALRQLKDAITLKNLALKGIDVMVFVAYKNLLGAMKSNQSFINATDRAIEKRLSELNLTIEDLKSKIKNIENLTDNQIKGRILTMLGINKTDIAEESAIEEYKDYIGKIFGVAKFAGFDTNEHRKVKHQIYPINITLENYADINPPIDFEEFIKESGLNIDYAWLKTRSFKFTASVMNNPAVSYLYDKASEEDVFK